MAISLNESETGDKGEVFRDVHLIRDAEGRGCVTLDGLGMLVNQGVIALKYWTGIDVDPTVMRRAVEEVLQHP